MDKAKITRLREFYEKELFESVVPFWERCAPDYEYGGILHCVERDGSLTTGDKCGWFQGRGTWVFAKLYNDFGQNPKWLEIAKLGYDFINEHCFDTDGRMFFELTRDGRPLRKRRYWFTEAFCCIAMAEYAAAAKDKEAMQRASALFDKIVYYYRNPAALPGKYIAENFQIKGHNTRMIMLGTCQVMRELDGAPKYDDFLTGVMEEMHRDFYCPERRVFLEYVTPDGQYIDSPIGRRVSPGHTIESMSFILKEAQRRDDPKLLKMALDAIDWSMERGWDPLYGGIFNYIDFTGKGCDKIEWDMKTWWQHAEALYALLLAYALTGDGKYERLYDVMHEYTFSHFPDREYGEWYGYLHRDGSLCLSVKGSMFKGPFHIPRNLMYCIQLLREMEAKAQ